MGYGGRADVAVLLLPTQTFLILLILLLLLLHLLLDFLYSPPPL